MFVSTVKMLNADLIPEMLLLGGEYPGHLAARKKRVDVVEEKIVTEHFGPVNVEHGVLADRSGIPDQLSQIFSPGFLGIV